MEQDNTPQAQEQVTQPIESGQTQEVVNPTVGEEANREAMPTSEEKQPLSDDTTLPEGVSERTREQFEKLKRQLAEEKAKNKQTPQYGNVYDTFRPATPAVDADKFQNLNNTQVNAITSQFVDSDGNVDIDGLNRALMESNERAKRAEELALQSRDQITRFEETREVMEAHSVHPEIDPNSPSFDPELFDLVRDRVLSNMYQGNKTPLVQVASQIKSLIKRETNAEMQVRKEEVEAKKTGIANQGPIENGRGENPSQTVSSDTLRRETRAGSIWNNKALDNRLDSYFKQYES